MNDICVPQMQAMLHEVLGMLSDPSPYTFEKPEDFPPMIVLSDTMSNASQFIAGTMAP